MNETLKQKLMEQACGNFKAKVENSEFEKPPEEETFKENAITEEAMKKALESEAQRAKIAQSAINGSYTITEDNVRRVSKKYEEKEIENKGSEYSWGRSYGYGSSFSTTTKTESADALRQKAAKKAVEKKMDQLIDKLDSFNDNKNIFELAAEHSKQHELEALKIHRPKEYDKRIQQSRFRSDITKGILGVLKDVLENINLLGGE